MQVTYSCKKHVQYRTEIQNRTLKWNKYEILRETFFFKKKYSFEDLSKAAYNNLSFGKWNERAVASYYLIAFDRENLFYQTRFAHRFSSISNVNTFIYDHVNTTL